MRRRFTNPYPHPPHHPGAILQWKLRLRRERAEPVDEVWHRVDDLRPAAVDADAIARPPPDTLQLTWIGHASFLLQWRHRAYLFDPIFAEYCAPVPLPGMRRLHPPALSLAQLPALHGVFLSHNHYDHLERRTVSTLGDRMPTFVPEGLGAQVRRMGARRPVEVPWWQRIEIAPGAAATATPAQHFSSRGLFDRDRTHWCGWMIELDGRRVYFVGDSGYGPLFREIGRRLGPMDLSVIPIGAYRPRWVMRPVHLDPMEAVQVHRDVGSRLSVASHWGTFRLTDEPVDEPPALLRRALAEDGVDPTCFRILRLGETLRLPLTTP